MVKRAVQSAIRTAHLVLARRSLPDRVGIYLHDLPERDWDGFRAMVVHFRRSGYEFVDALELCAPREGRKVYLSFDDNFRSWFAARPLFDELGIRATFYVNTLPFRDRIDRSELAAYRRRIGAGPGHSEQLTMEELSALVDDGHVLGAHTHSHPVLSRLPEAEAQEEILHSRSILEDITGSEVIHFAYPRGLRRYFNEELRTFCLGAGFRTVANAIPGLQFSGQEPDRIQRTRWIPSAPLERNLNNLRIDGRLFESLTGRAATPV